MEQQKKKEDQAPQVHQDSPETTSKLNPTAAKILRESIIGEEGSGGKEGEKKGEGKEGSSPDKVLAYSRAVHHVDSSLE